MKLTILGSGSALPVADRNPSGYLLDIKEQTILIDSGAGTSRQLARAGRSLEEIDKIFYSHFHIDHIGDLPSILFALKNENYDVENLDIYAHPNFVRFLESYEDLYGDWILGEESIYQFHPLINNKMNFSNFGLKTYPAKHRPESLIYSFHTQNKKFVYTGDTNLCDKLLEAAQEADLLLTECSFSDEQSVEGHMSPTRVKQVIKNSVPKRVVLTHLYPENDREELADEIQLGTDCQVSIATDLQEIEI